ncbi:hypothetical protein [Ottowia sp. VDI28]|uniref:capsular polysaccharide export protein, LipB/KpsS family n=1 Tax=Ottowia sp. VDI28 TaxID=3133968 RepID=UPI003C2C155E
MNKLKTITWHEQRLYGLNGRHETTAEACHSSTKHKASGFAGKRILLLQGPVGPFFWNLAKDLRSADATIFKFNFNAGDWLFYPRGASSFRGELPQWPAVLEAFIVEHQIDAVLIFGDCRPVHRCVPALTERLGCALGVFEEGYLRPDHVTFEPRGVNGHSNFHEHLAARLKQRSRMGLALSSHAPVPSGKPWKKWATRSGTPPRGDLFTFSWRGCGNGTGTMRSITGA